jgi:hypothetical protein
MALLVAEEVDGYQQISQHMTSSMGREEIGDRGSTSSGPRD